MKLGNQGHSFLSPRRIKIYHFSGNKGFPHFIQSITHSSVQETGPVWATMCLMWSVQAAVRMTVLSHTVPAVAMQIEETQEGESVRTAAAAALTSTNVKVELP